jgi:AcrR family transcriptional regulator
VAPVARTSTQLRLDALLHTACEVIAERGLGRTRAADVAAAAGVSQALVFYHFDSKEKLLAAAVNYAAERDLARLDAVLGSGAPPLERLRRILRLQGLGGEQHRSWAMWIDGWAESVRVPELERVLRGRDLRWREAVAEVIAAGVATGAFECADPRGAAWRITGLIDGLTVQLVVHDRVVSRRQLAEWVRSATAREVGVAPDLLA